MIKNAFKNILFCLKKNQYTFSPVFIIGCGRSGTTILGNTLSKHDKIKYLNERRDLWHKAYPEFNIWQVETDAVLFANEKKINPKKNDLLKNLLFQQQVLSNKKLLLEKLPINNFRLQFLDSSFKNAKYIYLTRNGLEVSHSINKKIEKNNWFTGKKYLLMNDFAKKQGYSFNPKTNLEKSMLEWRLSMEQSHQFFKEINDKKYVHLSYEDLITDSEIVIKKILDFLQLSYSSDFCRIITKNINRRNDPIKKTDNNSLIEIGGNFLMTTINNTYNPNLVY